MKILMLLGSAHTEGTSAALAESFAKGAEEKGHEVSAINCAKLNVHPCIGCGNCVSHGVCVWTDDMPQIENAIKCCDALIFVTPVYYSGITAQLKTAVDRFFSFNQALLERKPAMGIITAAGEPVFSSSGAVMHWFEQLISYVGSKDLGSLNAVNVHGPRDLDGTDYLEKAYEFGRSV